MIRLEDVAKRFAGAAGYAVDGVDLTVAEGELLVLLGASGSGKTTTLKMVNRLVEPTRGRVVVDGRDIAGVDPATLRRGIGYVLQGIGLFPHLTVGENVAVVPRLLGWAEAEVRRRIDALLALVDLDPAAYRDRSPRSLSGGEQQRVGVARALAGRPRVMLMDEPFGAVDPITRDGLQAAYRRLHGRLGLTTVLVTHDMTEALLLADRIAVLDAGRLLGVGTPRALLRDPGPEGIRRLMETPRRQAEALEALLDADADADGDGDGDGDR